MVLAGGHRANGLPVCARATGPFGGGGGGGVPGGGRCSPQRAAHILMACLGARTRSGSDQVATSVIKQSAYDYAAPEPEIKTVCSLDGSFRSRPALAVTHLEVCSIVDTITICDIISQSNKRQLLISPVSKANRARPVAAACVHVCVFVCVALSCVCGTIP